MTTSHEARKRSPRGFSLIELLVAVTISGLVLAGVLTTTVLITRGGIRLANYSEMDVQIRRALEQFGGEARLATDLTWNGTSDVTLTVPDENGATSTVTYAWSSATQSFFRVPGVSSAATTGRIVLVRDLAAPAGGTNGVVFERLTRTGTAATTDAAAKFVRVSFTLSRTRIPGTSSTERASAVFALRNKPAT